MLVESVYGQPPGGGDVDVGCGLAGGVGRASDAVALFEAVERQHRLLEVAYVDALAEVDRSGVFVEHGHASAKVMMAHVAQLSGGVAMARDRVRRMIAVAGKIDRIWRAGALGVEQARLLGRVFTNVRVRDAFLEQQDWFLRRAREYAFVRFERAVADWVNLHDQDGTEPDDRAHANRDAKLIQDHFSRGWHFEAHGPSLAGAIQREIFDAYIEAEFAIDWEAAVAAHGEAVCMDLLARTDAQRRYDAFHQMCLDAANNPNSSTGVATVHNIVWDHDTFEEMVARLAGAEPKPLDLDTFRCSTIDGHRIDPNEAIIDAITNQIRRVVVNAKSV